MTKSAQNFWVSDNRGINPRGGVDYYLLQDKATDRQSAEAMVLGGRPYRKNIAKPGEPDKMVLRAPYWSKVVHVKVGAAPPIQGQRIIRGTMIKESMKDGRERYVIDTGTNDPNHYVSVTVGYDAIDDGNGAKSPANHRRKIMGEMGHLSQFGAIAFDCEALKLLMAAEGDTGSRLLNPNVAVIGGQSKAEQQGRTKNAGKYIPEIDCFETEVSQWLMHPRDALLKVTAWGEVRLIRILGGIAVEKKTEDPLLISLAVDGIATEKEAQRRKVVASKEIILPANESLDLAEGVQA